MPEVDDRGLEFEREKLEYEQANELARHHNQIAWFMVSIAFPVIVAMLAASFTITPITAISITSLAIGSLAICICWAMMEFRLNVYTDTIYDRLKILEDAKHLNMDLHGSLHRTLQGRWPVRTKVVVAMGLTLLLVAWIVRFVGFFVYHV